MPCSDKFTLQILLIIQRYNYTSKKASYICGNSWYQLKIATKPKIAQEGNKMKYLTN